MNSAFLVDKRTVGFNGAGGLGQDYEQVIKYLCESSNDNIVANPGGGQANATQLAAMTNRVVTVATTGDSVKLPISAPGLELMIINHGANAMQVYGYGSDTINDVAAATGVSQMTNSLTIYTCATAGQWYTEGLASGFFAGFQTMSYANGLTAGTTQSYAGGTPILNMINRFTTVATTGNSAALPSAVGGMSITITNAGVNSMNIYPSATDSINGGANGAAYALAAGKTACLTSAAPTIWHAILSA